MIQAIYSQMSDGEYGFTCAFDTDNDPDWKDHVAMMRDWAEDNKTKIKIVKSDSVEDLLDSLECEDLDEDDVE